MWLRSFIQPSGSHAPGRLRATERTDSTSPQLRIVLHNTCLKHSGHHLVNQNHRCRVKFFHQFLSFYSISVDIADCKDILFGKNCPHIRNSKVHKHTADLAFSICYDPDDYLNFIAPDKNTVSGWLGYIGAGRYFLDMLLFRHVASHCFGAQWTCPVHFWDKKFSMDQWLGPSNSESCLPKHVCGQVGIGSEELC